VPLGSGGGRLALRFLLKLPNKRAALEQQFAGPLEQQDSRGGRGRRVAIRRLSCSESGRARLGAARCPSPCQGALLATFVQSGLPASSRFPAALPSAQPGARLPAHRGRTQ